METSAGKCDGRVDGEPGNEREAIEFPVRLPPTKGRTVDGVPMSLFSLSSPCLSSTNHARADSRTSGSIVSLIVYWLFDAHSTPGLAFIAYWGIILFGYDTCVVLLLTFSLV